jgi:hypothetical protein
MSNSSNDFSLDEYDKQLIKHANACEQLMDHHSIFSPID